MASEDEVVIDMEEDTANEPLLFNDYHDDVNSHVTGELTIDEGGAGSDDKTTQQSSSEQQQTTSSSIFSLLTISYYQNLFDVTTSQVLLRMLWSMVPRKQSYLELLKPNADLYGPFWVPMTLLFSIAIAGNLTKLLSQSSDTSWEFNFDQGLLLLPPPPMVVMTLYYNVVTVMAGVIFSYTWLVPMILWAILSWQGLAVATMLETIAIYGYSLTIYIPICLLWLLPIPWLQWVLVIVGVIMSGLVMLIALRPSASAVMKTQFGNIVMLVMMLLHAGLGVGFKIYYIHSGFYYSVSSDSSSSNNININTSATTSATTQIIPSL